MDFAEAYLLTKLGHPELAGWWGKVLGGGGAIDDGGDKPFDALTWDQVIASTKTGKYKTFPVRAAKDMDLGVFGTMSMQIVGIDADYLADGTGKAPLSLIMVKCFDKASYPMTSGADVYWPNTAYRNWLLTDVWPELPQIIRDNIKSVIKYTYTKVGNAMQNNVESIDTLWAPSVHEVFPGESGYETAGPTYSGVFSDNTSRIKRDSAGPQNWYLRTASRPEVLRCVRYTGAMGSPTSETTQYTAVMGFCL